MRWGTGRDWALHTQPPATGQPQPRSGIKRKLGWISLVGILVLASCGTIISAMDKDSNLLNTVSSDLDTPDLLAHIQSLIDSASPGKSLLEELDVLLGLERSRSRNRRHPQWTTLAEDKSIMLSFDKIWYAPYGSNLFSTRLNWYLLGGRAPTSKHWYTPCPDPTPIQARFSGQLPYKLFFGRRSLIWSGSKAFIHNQIEPDKSQHSQAAFYLMNRGQFEHVVWQENWQSELPEALPLPIEELASSAQGKGHSFIKIGYKSDYNSLILCGTARSPNGLDPGVQYPVVSFTTDAGMRQDELGRPSKPYLQHIAEGLRQSFPLWDDEDVARYLAGAPGADSLPHANILAAVAEHLHIEDPRMADNPPPPLLAYQGGRGAEVKTWQNW